MPGMTFGKQLRIARIAKNLTQKQLADLIAAKHNSISNWENDLNRPDPDTIEAICRVLDITPNYLLGAKPDDFSPEEKLLVNKYKELDDFGRQTVNIVIERELERAAQAKEAAGTIEKLQRQAAAHSTLSRLLSYYGKIAASGQHYSFEDMIRGMIQVPLTDENRHADYAIGISGNSMEPDFTEEDIVYVQKAAHLNKGEIGIFQKENCIYIKKVGDGELLSLNPDYGSIPGQDAKALGRVLGKIEGDYQVIT